MWGQDNGHEEAGVTLAALHHALIRIAGWAPDGLVTAARTNLAGGQVEQVAATIAFAAAAYGFALLDGDRRQVVESLGAAADPRTAEGLRTVARLGLPCVRWSAPPVDRIAVPDLSEPGLDGIWRAWRLPGLPSLWPPPREVFLIQAARPGHELPALTARIQDQLERAGVVDPQVEVFADGSTLPPYHRAALVDAELVWTPRGNVALTVAGVFDPVAATGGPGYSAHRPRLSEAEQDRVVSYLDGGTPVVASPARLDDVVDSSRHAVVPTGFRTDGAWIWCDASAYYARTHAIAPEPGLRDHIARRPEPVPAPVDLVDVHRALAALRSVPVQ